MGKASVSVSNLRKAFTCDDRNGSPHLDVLGGIDLDIREGEFVSFFGPNGCGKTTFLSIVGGLMEQDSGTVLVSGQAPEETRVGFIFQNYRESLYPWLRNLDNVAFPLEIQGMRKKQRRAEARHQLEYLGLNIPADGYPYQLSGGQQQLLAVARALIFKADMLLMDEPFASLDYSTRFMTRDLVQSIWMKTGTTTLFVSHSIEEAIYLADRVILLSSLPCRIVDQIEVPFKRPRQPAIMEGDEFLRLQAHALRISNKEMSR